MQQLFTRCAGLDVHQATVVVCVRIAEPGKKVRRERRSFETFKDSLEEMATWLKSLGATHVFMESTGIYWMPVFSALEHAEGFDITVGNAEHIRNVPGRKTDMSDAEWLADLGAHGLIRKSFVPPEPFRELRKLLRYRRGVVEARTTERNRALKLIDSANIKLSTVVSDVFGKSGMLMLDALVEAQLTPEQMAELAKGAMRKKLDTLKRALDGRMKDVDRFMLKLQLERLRAADANIEALDNEIKKRLEPWADQLRRLCDIPGVEWVCAATIIAELGVDMAVFPSIGKAAAWAGVCPSNNISAGKRLRKASQTRTGNVHLCTALVQAAQSAVKTKNSYYRDKFFRLKARSNYQKAIMAIAHKLLKAAYAILKTPGLCYADLGDTYLASLDKEASISKHVRALERLGVNVSISQKELGAIAIHDEEVVTSMG